MISQLLWHDTVITFHELEDAILTTKKQNAITFPAFRDLLSARMIVVHLSFKKKNLLRKRK